MKKFSMAAAAAIVAGAMFVPAASATVSDEQFEAGLKSIKEAKCADFQVDKASLEKNKIKTRNDAYDAVIEEINKLPDDNPGKLTKEQARKQAALYADRFAECGFVSFPVTERVTTFFGSKGQNSSTSSIGGFSS